MANGIVRKIDELGRITIPKEIRNRYEIKEGDRLGIDIDGKVFHISKVITSMSRPVDELGRITIPMEFRNTLKFVEHQELDTWVEDGVICIAKYAPGCIICGSSEQLMDVDGIKICRSCGVKVITAFSKEE